MKISPILFNTDMVKAILDGRKCVTRRLIKPQPKSSVVYHLGQWQETETSYGGHIRIFPPPYQPGDILYVRETWSFWPCYDCDNEMCYGGKNNYQHTDGCFVYKTQRSKVPYEEKWRPSIHMSKEAARIFLKIKSVRVERLQDITADECPMEGVQLYSGPAGQRARQYRTDFATLWDSTIKPNERSAYGWDANPWVWVVRFEPCAKPEGF